MTVEGSSSPTLGSFALFTDRNCKIFTQSSVPALQGAGGWFRASLICTSKYLLGQSKTGREELMPLM